MYNIPNERKLVLNIDVYLDYEQFFFFCKFINLYINGLAKSAFLLNKLQKTFIQPYQIYTYLQLHVINRTNTKTAASLPVSSKRQNNATR